MDDTANTVVPIRWKDVTSVYPGVDEIATALQDRGVSVVRKSKKKGDTTMHKYTLVQKLASKVHTSIKKDLKPEGLTLNNGRGTELLHKDIILSRRHVDVSEADPFSTSVGGMEKFI